MAIPAKARFSDTHEWVLSEGDTVICGISDYAQNELSDIVFVELPEVGKQVAKGDVLCIIESVKAASDMYAAVSGTITAANDALSGEPELMNTDPYGSGHICTIALSDPSELDALIDADAYTKKLQG